MASKILTSNLDENLKIIYENAPSNFNFIKREIIIKGNIKCVILYINGLAKQEYIESSIIHPLLFRINEDLKEIDNIAEYISQRYISTSNIEISKEIDMLSLQLKHGKCIVLVERGNSAIICGTVGGVKRQLTESTSEKNLKGGKEAFVENLEINIAIVQDKLKNDKLKMDRYILGEQNKSEAILLYMDGIIDPKILSEIKKSIDNVKMPYIPDTGYIKQMFERFPYAPFPQLKSTEKPDKVISDILQGKAALILNGSPIALVMPSVFIEFFQTAEDYESKLWYSNFDRIMRMMAVLIILTISPVYLVILTYNSELTPLTLQKIVVDSRLGIPIPPFLEILLMELLIDFLREGGLRLPTPIGQTLAIVGGIVLGDAATKAGLVSSTTLVVVSVSVICTFVIPNYDMALNIRILRYFMFFLSVFFALFGIIIGLFFILATLVKMDSFGVPYLSPLAPLRYKNLRDSFIRAPIQFFNRNPVGFKTKQSKGNKNGSSKE